MDPAIQVQYGRTTWHWLHSETVSWAYCWKSSSETCAGIADSRDMPTSAYFFTLFPNELIIFVSLATCTRTAGMLSPYHGRTNESIHQDIARLG
jgi:hypothetical protein